MDTFSADESTAASEDGFSENVNGVFGCNAQEVTAGDELAHGHRVTGSQSSIEYEKFGDSRRRGTGPRSKSFLEEPSRSKAALFMQRKPGGKGVRSTHGSHGDGICLGPTWDNSRGLVLSESVDRGGDQHKKLQIVITETSKQASGVTQKLFDSNVWVIGERYLEGLLLSYCVVIVFCLIACFFLAQCDHYIASSCGLQTQTLFHRTFADLVRVCTAQDNSGHLARAQLGNTLLSTVHASALVSNYLNTYRSYLDQLRKTCGRGESHVDLISARASTETVPLVLPLARMTPVFSDDSREDPEFLELLKKTTTESIRKLWPHPNKTNIVRKAGLVEIGDGREEQTALETDSCNETPQDSGNSETCRVGSLVPQYRTNISHELGTYENNEESQGADEETYLTEDNSLLRENTVCHPESLNTSTNNPNLTMKSSAEAVLVGDGGSVNIQNKTSTQIQKGLLRVSNDALTSGDNFYNHANDPSSQGTHGTSIYSDAGQHKVTSEAKGATSRPSAIDTFLQHQQKLMQQQQLQRQILQHQQQQQLQQQQRQQQQMMQQYQQQEQQRQHSEQSAASKAFGYQLPGDASKNWLQAMGDNTGLASYKACLSTGTQSTSSYNTGHMLTQAVGADSFSNGQQINPDYFNSGAIQPHTTPGAPVDALRSGLPITSAHTRTLKASYACLDPSNPMTLSVDPLQEYTNPNETFANPCELSQYETQSYANLATGFGTNERGSCSEASRSWAELSRPVTSALDSEAANAENALEERLRRAYANSHVPQFSQQNQWVDTSRLSVQRPIVKINPESNHETQTYNFQSQRGFLDTRRNSCASFNNINAQDRWNCITGGAGSAEAIRNDGMIPGSAADPRENDGAPFLPLATPTVLDQSSRVSRLYQWKQDVTSSSETNYFPTARSPTKTSGFATSESVANSLLSGLQLDRDFSWNASPMPSQLSPTSAHGTLSQSVDGLGMNSDNRQYKFPDSYMNKLSTLSLDQRRQVSNNNNVSMIFRNQNDQANGSNLFFDVGEAKHEAWSLKGRTESTDDTAATRLNSAGCGPMLSQSMQILNSKILAAQNSTKGQQPERKSANIPTETDILNDKKGEKCQSDTSSPSSVDSQSSGSLTKLRLSRAFSDPNNAHTVFTTTPQSSASLSQLSVLQQQQQARQKVDTSVMKLSEDFDKAYLDDAPSRTPWHELASQENNESDFDIESNFESNSKYVQLQNFDGSTMILSDQDMATLRSNDANRLYSTQSRDHFLQSAVGSQLSGTQMQANQQTSSRPRMILGANSVKQMNEDKVKAEVEESNRRLREMLGLAPNKDQGNSTFPAGMRLSDNSPLPQQPSSPGMMQSNMLPGSYNQNNLQSTNGQMSRVQFSGSKIQTPMGMAQQMYCVPNILMPPPPVQSPTSNRQSNMIPLQGVMTSMGSSTRFPQGMIRVPFVDMSRLVYVHQMPMNMSSTHQSNNNHNNSSSSNPHVNTSNIITINTSDNDFSVNGQGDKLGRHTRSNPPKNKTAFLKMRSGSEEFAVPILGMRPSLDDSMGPRLVKTRTNPWDQDLDHDFSNSLMSKAVSMENMASVCSQANVTDPNMCNPELGLVYPDMSMLQGGSQTNTDQASKTTAFMQWPATADMHPEMLDMLPVRRTVPEDCGTGRLCWPEMEFLMSSREQLQTARRSNKPMGSNKANLISIIPRGGVNEGATGGKECRFEKLDNKLA